MGFASERNLGKVVFYLKPKYGQMDHSLHNVPYLEFPVAFLFNPM